MKIPAYKLFSYEASFTGKFTLNNRICLTDVNTRTITPVKLTGFTILFENFYFMLYFLSTMM